MNEGPLISVIMPVYNCEKYIDVAVRSIIRQTYNNWELIIGDDGSTDNSVIKIEKFKDNRIRLFRHVKNLGPFGNRNLLLKEASGAFITFQDGDDYSDDQRLALQLQEFNRNPKLGMVGCQQGYTNEKGVVQKVSRKPLTYHETLHSMYETNVIGSAMMMVKRDVLKVVGGYREYFNRLSYQDYDLAFLIAQKYECYCLPEVLYFYRQHDRSISKVIDADRLLAKDVVVHLAKQRKERGTDDLMDGNPEKVDAFFASLREPYFKDPSLVYRQYASSFMYSKLHKKAIYAAWLAVSKRPGNLVNWGTLQYCIRKTFFNRA